MDDSLGNAKNKILAYLDEAISGLDDNPWDDGTRTLTVADWSTHGPADVWAEDTGGVALTKYGGAVLDHNDYKADVSNLDEPISGLDDNPWNNALTDTGSGMGDRFADYFNAVFGPKFDSLVQAVADANKANFKADVSGLSTFDNTSDAVIVGSANSLSFDSVDFKPDYWSAVASHSDSGAIGSSPWTAAGVGSVYVYLNSLLTLSESIVHFWGACDSCYTRHFPEDGSANKDSFYVIDGKRTEADSLLGKGEFRHSNEDDVADSTYFYKYPWWE